MTSRLLDSLTEAQRTAVCHVDGPLLILAGPGSGKTRVVTHRMAHLVEQGVPAHQILGLTFTNKAADEMRQRLEGLIPGQPVWMGTFHRFCSYLLRRHASLIGLRENFSILDVDDSRRLLKQALVDARVDLQMATPESIASAISWAKNNLIDAASYRPRTSSAVGSLAGRVYPEYQKRLLRANAVDFDDLLLHVATLLRENPDLRQSLDRRYRYVLVDEYQDTNLAQYAIVRSLSIDFPNLAVTGDPDQSIYGWRGANLSNILDFEQDFPGVRVVRLEQNYRSTPNILRVAEALIGNNRRRKAKALFTENPAGAPVRLVEFPTQQDEADQIAARIMADVSAGRRRPRDFAVFYRVNSLSRSIERSFRDLGLPFQIVHGVEFYQRKEVKDLLAYLQLVNNPDNDAAVQRIINTPTRSIGATTVDRLQMFVRGNNLTLFEAARRCGVIPGMKARTALAVARFVTLLDRLRELATAPVATILEQILRETGFREQFSKSEEPDDLERLSNIEELVNDAAEFDHQHPHEAPLEGFLERAALVNDTDDMEANADRVTLMTLHAAKGLEFPVVFVVGVEQGLIPHERSREDANQLEEERRLLFVGITRAEQELQLSYCLYRVTHGLRRSVVPSPFLVELPRSEMDIATAPRSPAFIDPEMAGDMAWDEERWLPARQLRDVDPDSYDRLNDSRDPFDLEAPTDEAPRLRPRAAQRVDKVVAAAPSMVPGGGLAALAGKLRTGAELAAAAEQTDATPVASPRLAPSPEVFISGMLVQHPEYGLGRIVQLVGTGPKRTATVRFAVGGAERKFRLIHSPLQPADNSK